MISLYCPFAPRGEQKLPGRIVGRELVLVVDLVEVFGLLVVVEVLVLFLVVLVEVVDFALVVCFTTAGAVVVIALGLTFFVTVIVIGGTFSVTVVTGRLAKPCGGGASVVPSEPATAPVANSIIAPTPINAFFNMSVFLLCLGHVDRKIRT